MYDYLVQQLPSVGTRCHFLLRERANDLTTAFTAFQNKAAEQMLGYHSLVYEPPVTAAHVPASVASSNQWLSPTRHRDFHIHVQPHSSKASRIVVGIVCSQAQSTCETITCFLCSTVLTVQILPQFSRNWPSFVFSQRAAARVDQPLAH